jgi:chemotaxis protein CheX
MSLLTSETVAQLAQEIWATLLAAEGDEPLVEEDIGSEEMVAVTEITGEWCGHVRLSCSRAAARHATAAMFATPVEDLSEADITDAIGELVNVVGGNIKSLLPGPTVLSLPVVSDDAGGPMPGHLELAQEVRFSWMAEPVVISVWADNSPRPQ